MGRFGSKSGGYWTLGLVVSALVLFLAKSRYQITNVGSIDLLLVLTTALAVTTLWFALRWHRHKDDYPRSHWRLSAFAVIAIDVGLLTGALLLALNGMLDRGIPKAFAGVVTRVQCYRTNCHAHVKGLPRGLAAGDSMVIDLQSGFEERPHQWDSVFVTVMPGFFGRPWIASHRLRHIDPDSLEGTQLAEGAASGDTARIRDLLGAKVSVDALNGLAPNYGETALMAAARAGKPVAVRMLLAHGGNPNHANDNGETALMLAVMSRCLECVRLLLASGANPRTQTHGPVVTSVMGLAVQTGDTLLMRTIGATIP
jgi:hypothetical protein